MPAYEMNIFHICIAKNRNLKQMRNSQNWDVYCNHILALLYYF